MNFIKQSLSLAGAFALAVSANAQSLEEAIKGVEVSGFLRYEYEDNRFKNRVVNRVDGLADKLGDIERNHIVNPRREILFQSFHFLYDAVGSFQSIGTGQLVKCD